MNPLHFGPRSTLPVLMINGEHDLGMPLETLIKPMFNIQGAPVKDKVLKLFKSGHVPPINENIIETLEWYDRYLGPVK